MLNCILKSLPFFALAIVGVSSTAVADDVTLSGPTQGTTYHIKLAELPVGLPREDLHADVEKLLEHLDSQLSTYRPDAELAKFNRNESTEWFDVSPELAEVVGLALDVSKCSGGAFDVTVGPLVELWGFGKEHKQPRIPSDAEISNSKISVGWQMLEVRSDPPALKKSRSNLRVDLNGIAPGFSVDQIGQLFKQRGVSNYLIELGGEILASGHNATGKPWHVGVEQPDERKNSIQMTVPLDAGGFSVSGDYRHFFELDQKRYSHIIDPATGRPIHYRGVSLAVAADTCAQADAWTKPFLVLGPDKGLTLADELGMAVCFVLRDSAKSYKEQLDGNYQFMVLPSAKFKQRFMRANVTTVNNSKAMAVADAGPQAGDLPAQQQPPENELFFWSAIGLCIAAYLGMRIWRRREPPPE